MLAALLDGAEHQVTIVDMESDSFEKLSDAFKGKVVLGDGTEDETLVKAGLAESDAFVVLTERDNLNILMAQIAKHIYEVPRVLCRIYDPVRSELYEELGLETFSPTRIVAHMLKNKLAG